MRTLLFLLALAASANPCTIYHKNGFPRSNGYVQFVEYQAIGGATKVFTFQLGVIPPVMIGWDDMRMQRCQ